MRFDAFDAMWCDATYVAAPRYLGPLSSAVVTVRLDTSTLLPGLYSGELVLSTTGALQCSCCRYRAFIIDSESVLTLCSGWREDNAVRDASVVVGDVTAGVSRGQHGVADPWGRALPAARRR
jgi:hypothetical protein